MAAKSEWAVRSVPGESPQVGKVVYRGGPRAAILVEWENGREQKVKPSDPAVRFAAADTRRFEWLHEPEKLRHQFHTDAPSVFIDVIKDEGAKIQTLQIKKRVIDLGLDAEAVNAAFTSAKAILRKNPHVVINGAAHSWSDVPVDPLASLRALDPHDALQRLVDTSRLAVDKKAALADAVRRALAAR